jgi:hypothetical protein
MECLRYSHDHNAHYSRDSYPVSSPVDGGKPVLSVVEGIKMGVPVKKSKSPLPYPSPSRGRKLSR